MHWQRKHKIKYNIVVCQRQHARIGSAQLCIANSVQIHSMTQMAKESLHPRNHTCSSPWGPIVAKPDSTTISSFCWASRAAPGSTTESLVFASGSFSLQRITGGPTLASLEGAAASRLFHHTNAAS